MLTREAVMQKKTPVADTLREIIIYNAKFK